MRPRSNDTYYITCSPQMTDGLIEKSLRVRRTVSCNKCRSPSDEDWKFITDCRAILLLVYGAGVLCGEKRTAWLKAHGVHIVCFFDAVTCVLKHPFECCVVNDDLAFSAACSFARLVTKRADTRSCKLHSIDSITVYCDHVVSRIRVIRVSVLCFFPRLEIPQGISSEFIIVSECWAV